MTLLGSPVTGYVLCCIAVSCYVVLCYALLCLAICQLYIVACHCLVNYQTEVKAGSWYDGHACYSFLALPTCLCDRATRNRKHVLVSRSRSLNEYMLCSSAVHANRMSWHLGRYACSGAAQRTHIHTDGAIFTNAKSPAAAKAKEVCC